MSPRCTTGGTGVVRAIANASRKRLKRAGLSGHRHANSHSAPSSEVGSIGAASIPNLPATGGRESGGRF